jgi:hypothetical protein
MTRKMAISLIIIGSLLLVTGLILGLRSIKPMYFNVIAGLIILLGSFFGLFGKQLQDKSSSEKSDKILQTSESTKLKVDDLKGDTKRLQYPLPKEIELTFDLDFKLKPEIFQKFKQAVAKHKIQFPNPVPGRGFLLSNDLLKEVLNWEKFCAIVSVHFSKTYRSGPTVEPIASFTNINLLSQNYKGYTTDISWNYFPVEEKFVLIFYHLKLELNKDLYAVAPDKYRVTSIVDLKDSKLLLSLACVQLIDTAEVSSLQLNSNELNLIKRKLDRVYGNELFLTEVKEL